ncbi:MAG: EamA family transporter [Acidimicrobiales bacterium]
MRRPLTNLERPLRDAPPEALFVAGAVSQYIGAAIAVALFDRLDPAAVAWLRVATAAAIVVAARRAWRRDWTASELRWAAAFGTALAVMNLSFYLAIAHLPLGTAVAIEFAGPVAVAALGSRGPRSLVALVLAAAGVLLLAEVQPEGNTIGVVYALVAGAAWAAYIVLGHRVARTGAAVDGLGVGMAIGALAIAVFGVPHLGPALEAPWLLVAAMATGLLSNAVPYAIDQVVLARIARDRFALLQALLPVTAVAVGLVALAQRPSPTELAGVALVVTALALRGRI